MGIIRLNGKEYNGGDLNAVETTSSAYSQLPSADKQNATKIYFLNDTQSKIQDTPIDATTFVNKKETSMSVSTNTTSLIWTYNGGSLIGASSFQPNAIPSIATKLKFKITTGSSYSTSEERFKLCIGVKAAYQQTDWVTPEDADWLVSKTYNTQNTIIEDYLDLSDVATDCYLMIACHGWTATFDEVTVEEVLPPTGNTEIKYKDTSYGSNGGGGDVYGAFIDINRVITSGTYIGTLTYIATEDCAFRFVTSGTSASSGKVFLDGEIIQSLYVPNNNDYQDVVFVKKGQTVRIESQQSGTWNYTVYGLTQGTNGIFAPVIYSDNERVIGVWRDNKPLYQKCINFGNLPNNGERFVAHGIANVDKIFIAGGFVTTGTVFYNLEHATDSNYDWSSKVDETNATIETHTDRSNLTAIIVVQYTKTTDVAGSGNWNTDGVPTVHYSTAEQVIGTWIDGKPLYQKTVIIPNTSQINNLFTYPHGITNQNYAKIVNAGTYDSSGNAFDMPLINNDGSNLGVRLTSTDIIFRGTGVLEINTNRYLYVTIQYTKTID